MKPHKGRHVGRGSTRRGDGKPEHRAIRRIVVSFDDDTFAQIRKRAQRTGMSFAEQVRLLCEWGLEA